MITPPQLKHATLITLLAFQANCIDGDTNGDIGQAAGTSCEVRSSTNNPCLNILSGTLNPGEYLERGTNNDTLTSNDGIFRLVMQGDGNLVIYHDTRAIWATNTDGTDGQKAIMQTDGNFVLYRVSGRPLWASNTQGHSGAYIVMQDDGNLVVYQGGFPLWASNTAGH